MLEKQTRAFGGLWQRPVVRRAGLVVALAIVFVVGIGVGDGRLALGKPASVTGLPEQLDYSSVNKVYQSIRENYNGKLTEQQLMNGLKHGLAEATNDPYTVYFTPKEAKNFDGELNGTFSGIGAQLGQDNQGTVQIIAPIAGTPAEKAGLKAKDLIVAINGKSTVGMSVDAAVNAIRGKVGTKVSLQIVRTGSDRPLNVSITRGNIQVPSVTTKTLDGNIGYISISTFGDDTAQLVDQAATKFAAINVKGMILDLRENPGGEVDAAVSVASQWLPANTMIMQEKHGSQVLQTYQSTGTNLFGKLPTVVLVDGGSASASEIVTAALHDNKHAYVIGQKTYGKGVVQQIVNYGDGSELKVTIASWYRPNGQNINHKGITPDQKVTISNTDAKAGNDTQLRAAEAYLQSK
jgi:carboxyl-terminal processing protease